MAIYREIYAGPPRWYDHRVTKKLYIVVHATANDASARDEASYATRRPEKVSSHYYVDGDSIVQSLDTDLVAYHAGSRQGNERGIAYELTAWNMNASRQWWLDLDHIEWPLFAAQVALDCRVHDITPRDLSVAQLREGKLTGFCTHAEANKAWGGSDHVDPGPNFPMDHLVRLVTELLEDDDMTPEETHKAVWKRDAIRAPEGYDEKQNPHWTAENVLRSAHLYSRSAWERTKSLAAGQEAILAAIAGHDVVAAVRTELDRHRQTLVPELIQALAPELVDELRDQLPAQQIEAALERVLPRLRLRLEPRE